MALHAARETCEAGRGGAERRGGARARPRLAIAPGRSYVYDFTVDDPAGLCWYHPHAHMRTARQTDLGKAGLILVRDGTEQAVDLPAGAQEIPLLLQDKRLDRTGALVYDPWRTR